MSETAAGSATGSPDDPVPGSGDPAAVGTKGGGEWPSKGAPPTGHAPGSDPARAAELREQRKERTTSGDGTAAGELHPPTRVASVYAEGQRDEEQTASGSVAPPPDDDEDMAAQDAGASRHRGPAESGAPTTEQT